MSWEPISNVSPESHLSNVLFEGQYIKQPSGALLEAPVKYCVGTIEYGQPINRFSDGIKTVRFKPLGLTRAGTKVRRD